jgi:beta propeller repeat protein
VSDTTTEASPAPTETPTEAPASDTPPPDDEIPAPSEETPEDTGNQEDVEEAPEEILESGATTTPETAQDLGSGQTPDTTEETSTTTDTTSSSETPHHNVAVGGGSAVSETASNEGTPSVDEATATSTASEAVDDTSADETNTEAEASAAEVPVVDEALARASQEEAALQAEEARQASVRESIKKEVESAFTKGCLTLDGVGYYCLKNFDGSAVGALTPSTAVTGVASQQEKDASAGTDKEIFITKGGESIQLTHNTWDDTFPAMDVSGKSVVWQGMADGRWQIFIADVSGTTTPVITQLTHGTESNFNPRVDGDTIVWQGWVDGNWEIFLADRLLPAAYYPLRPDTPQDPGGGLPAENRMLGIDNTWHVTRLTTNDTHDMFPSIAGGLVTWQSSQGGSWNVYAYSIKSGVTTKLSQDGTKSENPRFAVTWDEHDANGNARMVGYDIASGKTIDITNEARNTPSGNAPYHPTETPISQPNQAALPPAGTSGTSTSVRADGDDAGGANPIGT